MTTRRGRIVRETTETRVVIDCRLDGTRAIAVRTGLGFLDHMLETLAFHAGWDLDLACEGDRRVGDHHTVEDCALSLGQVLDRALGDRAGCARFGHAYAPLDEALARSVIDLAGRPYAAIRLDLKRECLGDVATENLDHFLRSFAVALRAGLHVDLLKGTNDHHRAEAAFKATALALRMAARRVDRPESIPSTKGTLR